MVRTGEDTILAIDDREHLFAGWVQITEPLFLDNRSRFVCHLWKQFGQ